jgi:hypothetical protein
MIKNNSIEALFQDKQYCFDEMCRIRQRWGVKGLTEEGWKAIDRTLGLMYLYCPDEIKTLVLSQMEESTRRQFYALT